MTPVFCCGFECGQLGSTGQHWTSATGFSIDTTIKRNGTSSLKFNSVQSGIFINNPISGGASYLVRADIYFTTLPTQNVWLINTRIRASSPINAGCFFNISDGKIYTRLNTFNTSNGILITTNRWYTIYVRVDANNNLGSNWYVEAFVDGVSCGNTGAANAVDVISSIRLYQPDANDTGVGYYDDILISATLADHPITNGAVMHFVPISDGTHTSVSTNIVKGTIAAPTGGGAITSATTDAFNRVNGVPLLGGASDNTFLINQAANDTGYVEVIFGPAPGVPTPVVAPRAVEVITADRQASTTNGNFITRLNDNGTTSDISNTGTVAGTTTDKYVRKHFATAPTGGAWTVVSGAGNFNNIRARFGFSSDANPDQYWRGIMIEAEFAEPPQKIVQIKQAVNRASTY